MSEYMKDLYRRATYGSPDARAQLDEVIRTSVDTGLVGFNGENIKYAFTNEMRESLNILSNIEHAESSNTGESILIDAHDSATIEGARTTIERVKESLSIDKDSRDKDSRMVTNAYDAIQYARHIGVSRNTIRSIWEILTDGVCENVSRDGTLYRSGMVYIGSYTRVVHTPCPPDKLEEFMNYYFKYEVTLLNSCIRHWYFVYLHPFCDGNGRFARLSHYCDLCNIDSMFEGVAISRSILLDVNGYYKAISDGEVNIDGNLYITKFIEYMLSVIVDAVNRSNKSTTSLGSLFKNAEG